MKIRTKFLMPVATRNNSYLRWSRYVFFAVGILALGYVGFVLVDARLFQADQSRRFQQALNGLKPPIIGDQPLHGSSISLKPAEADPVRAERLDMAGTGDAPLGRIEISAIGLAAIIMEGTDARTLRRAVGHIPGTPLPGQQGNVAITGHRDTFFRPLLNIRKDDEIRLTTLSGSYRYLVDSIKVVEPEDTEVLDNSDDAILTLVTCYPFYFVGPAPKRFIVRAHRIPV
jgi:sortase A